MPYPAIRSTAADALVVQQSWMENKELPEAQEAVQAMNREWQRQMGPYLSKKTGTSARWSKEEWEGIAKAFRAMWPCGDCQRTTRPDDCPDYDLWYSLCGAYHDLAHKAGKSFFFIPETHPEIAVELQEVFLSSKQNSSFPPVFPIVASFMNHAWPCPGGVGKVKYAALLDQARKGLESMVLLQFEQPREKWLMVQVLERAKQLPILKTHRYQVHLLVVQLANRRLLKLGRSTLPQTLTICGSRFRQYKNEFPTGVVLKEVQLLLFFSNHEHQKLYEHVAHKLLRQELGNSKFHGQFSVQRPAQRGAEDSDVSMELYDFKHLAHVEQKLRSWFQLRVEDLEELKKEHKRA